jgi:hypothetical protein
MATDTRSIHRVPNRSRLVGGLALALIATALAIPGAAAAVPVGAAPVPGTDQAHRATAAVQEPSTTATAQDSAGGFDGGDAMIGAGGALGLIALIGAGGFTLRARQRMTPATPSQG